jgi:hypothetical protein
MYHLAQIGAQNLICRKTAFKACLLNNTTSHKYLSSSAIVLWTIATPLTAARNDEDYGRAYHREAAQMPWRSTNLCQNKLLVN